MAPRMLGVPAAYFQGRSLIGHVVRGHLALRDHVAAVQERQAVAQQMLLGVQHADAERGEHLVERERQVVDVQGLDVDGAGGYQLRPVDQQQGPPLAARLVGTRCASAIRRTAARSGSTAEEVGRPGAADQLGAVVDEARPGDPGRADR